MRLHDTRHERRRGWLVQGVLLFGLLVQPLRASEGRHGADELFWVPTFDQALEMAAHTRRPIFLMYYTLVDERAATFSGKGTVC